MKKQTPTQRREIINDAGGISYVAREFGISRQAVLKWVNQGFPIDGDRRGDKLRRLAGMSGRSLADIDPEIYDGMVEAG